MKNTSGKSMAKGKLPATHHQASGDTKKGIEICENCNIFHYKKAWHHDADTFIAARENKDIPVSFTLCPACTMIKNRQFEGKVTIKNIPDAQKTDLMNMIKNFCDNAFDRDPLERLIEVALAGDAATVTVTNNQLAQRIGKKIKDAFNTVKVTTAYLREPGDVANVMVEFLEK